MLLLRQSLLVRILLFLVRFLVVLQILFSPQLPELLLNILAFFKKGVFMLLAQRISLVLDNEVDFAESFLSFGFSGDEFLVLDCLFVPPPVFSKAFQGPFSFAPFAFPRVLLNLPFRGFWQPLCINVSPNILPICSYLAPVPS
ncbi:hypothetical protein QBC44DRAFT_323247 [Cladorrhinum sp. PSN332]|nr:hypothetical protein QBC44DRAFT_323247 [Cladorrhinum sp. PSN332]